MKTLPNKLIQSDRLTLVCGDEPLLLAAVAGDENLARHLGVATPPHWSEFGKQAWTYALEKIRTPGEEKEWWTYFPVLKEENMLVGSGGYKGPPDTTGMVEIGYEIAAAFRRRGLATEMAKALIRNAFTDERVQRVQAHTLAEENASTRVLVRCGLRRIAEIEISRANKIWRWSVGRETWKQNQ